MIDDAANIDDPSELSADVCIIGAGAAGITMALELNETSLDVIVLEGGGDYATSESQSLYEGSNVGRPYYDPMTTRLRYFGGSTNHYAGHFAQLDVLDYEKRPGLPETGWPISEADLRPFYEKAHVYCQIGPMKFSPEYWNRITGYKELPFDKKLFRSVVRQAAATRFASAYREQIANSTNVRALLNANVLDILTGNSEDVVERVEVATQTGRRFAVKARCFVLATGGLENPRILLNANSQRSEGIGNENDLVGRYFMEHIGVYSGRIAFANEAFDERFYSSSEVQINRGPNAQQPFYISGFLCPQPDVVRREGLANLRMSFHHLPKTRRAVTGMRTAKNVAEDLIEFRRRGVFSEDLGYSLANLDAIAGHILGIDPLGQADFYQPDTIIEQLPNPSSRVRLDTSLDRFGKRQLAIDWHWTAEDKRSVVFFQKMVAKELGLTGAGRMKLDLSDDAVSFGLSFNDRNERGDYVRGGNHHIGTTRMSHSPNSGVTNPDCRVHSTKNLYIGGSSVFPTAGLWNPTLTIVALAARLARHIEREYA